LHGASLTRDACVLSSQRFARVAAFQNFAMGLSSTEENWLIENKHASAKYENSLVAILNL
jgi:hypothetical protein